MFEYIQIDILSTACKAANINISVYFCLFLIASMCMLALKSETKTNIFADKTKEVIWSQWHPGLRLKTFSYALTQLNLKLINYFNIISNQLEKFNNLGPWPAALPLKLPLSQVYDGEHWKQGSTQRNRDSIGIPHLWVSIYTICSQELNIQ